MEKNKFIIRVVGTLIGLFFWCENGYAVEFNTDVLDAGDRKNIDFSRFSQAGYIMPGRYQLQIVVNGQNVAVGEQSIAFLEVDKSHSPALPQACVAPAVVDLMGLTAAARERVRWWHQDRCADFSALPGTTVNANLANATLNINLPQAFLEYSDATWLPPSRWENGIPGLLLDYNLNGNLTRPQSGRASQSLSYNGTTGANLGPWRFRADYQGNMTRTSGSQAGSSHQFNWNRLYLYRALPRLQSRLMVGENYLNSDLFSTWAYSGASLESDDRMLPPKLRGYAPQITGIADTNARVVVRQQDRVLYDSTVPAGPFTIQDLDSSIRGRLDVEIIESNGQKKTFSVDTSYVPYLTRPGQVRYKVIGGRPREYGHRLEGPAFVASELSWGVNNAWSLYGGSIVTEPYQAVAMGLGRDLLAWGTLSTDLTQSVARFDGQPGKKGKSWRFSYAKNFDQINTDITFTGYRFSERDYLTMQQYLDTRYHDDINGHDKELYTLSVSKYFTDLHTSVNLQYSHQTYWDIGASNYYTASINRYFDWLGIKNMSLGLTASRTKYQGRDNNAFYLRLSLPLGDGLASYSGSLNDKRSTQTVGYSSSRNGGLDNYNLNAGISRGGESAAQLNGYYSRHSPLADLSASFTTVNNQYSAASLSASGGATLTAKGAALHAGGINGGTRLLVSTDGIGDVPVAGGRVRTNRFGIAVVTDINSYYRNTVSVDVNKLPDDMEATQSVVETSLTEGAIGYRQFAVLQGVRLFVVLRTADNGHPPFGASVVNAKGHELGMVSDEGLAWLSGVTPGETLGVRWEGQERCRVTIPAALQPEQQLLLPCR
ncbi:fimbria/pilus outer membrane usher protein [Pantoea sp. 1.19]|uniref:fimbria/pilus outer membrane usher protein n=1 Tax=Pantoea sp. 1.19 TaxID=1925589 RepID=UPI000948D5B4|nr:fimbria/pilus outer membrane usher protein [Pantoea sp. 1.19]